MNSRTRPAGPPASIALAILLGLVPSALAHQNNPIGGTPRTTPDTPREGSRPSPASTTNSQGPRTPLAPGSPAESVDPLLPPIPGGPSDLETVGPELLADARAITNPGERSLALQRIGRLAIFNGRLDKARESLTEAGQAASAETDYLIKTQRLNACVNSLLLLAEEEVRLSRESLTILDAEDDADAKAATPTPDKAGNYRRAIADWQYAARLAQSIPNPTFRAEQLYKVVESQGLGSHDIASEPVLLNAFEPPAQTAGDVTKASKVANPEIADRILRDATETAFLITRPAWRDQALDRIVPYAATSLQFKRGLVIARTIPSPEVRANALMRLAQEQSLHGDADDATVVFTEAAQAVAQIKPPGLRIILARILIDSLIAGGRFEDARATVPLIPSEQFRVNSLIAIARGQGERGAAESAMAWIRSEMPPEYQPTLERSVNDGIISAIERNRSRGENRGF
ncbi:hypothetical protein EP7_003771 [Isosphaeraceae bacterium EP7]